MVRLAEVEARITSMSGLLEVVSAMRSLSGMRLQEAQRALPAARRYAQGISTAMATALGMTREPPSQPHPRADRRLVVLYAAEHGFVGALNERLLAAAQAALSPDAALFVLGSRAAAIAAERGAQAAWTSPMAARPGNVPETVRRLTDELYRRIALGELSRVDLVYAPHDAAGLAVPQRRTLIPVDLTSLASAAPRRSPLSNLAPGALLEDLTAEYVFALLAQAALESLAGENAARFAAMTAARDNVSKRLDALRGTARQMRQSEITTELLDVVTGAEAFETRFPGA
jgi:F-type H+-transporting ATPase subunit gamma